MGDNPYTCYKGTIPWGIILRGGSLRKQKKKYHFVERTTASRSRFTFLQMVGSQVASGGLNGRFKKRNITRCSFFIIPRLLHLQCGRSSAFDDLVNGQISAIVNCRSAYIQTKIIQITELYNFIFFFKFFFHYYIFKH